MDVNGLLFVTSENTSNANKPFFFELNWVLDFEGASRKHFICFKACDANMRGELQLYKSFCYLI